MEASRWPAIVMVVLVVVCAGYAGRTWVSTTVGDLFDRHGGRPEKVYGPIITDAGAYRKSFQTQLWLRDLPIGHSTFGRLLARQVRMRMDGTGSMSERRTILETPVTSALWSGRSRDRVERFIRGYQDLLDHRRGFVRGIGLSPTRDGFSANYVVNYVAYGAFTFEYTPEQREFIRRYLAAETDVVSTYSDAWYQFDSTWIVVGPRPTKLLLKHFRGGKLTVEEGMYVSHVLRHEMEHSVSATTNSDQRKNWIEESLADTLALWPNSAVTMARAIGVPYDKRMVERPYDAVRKPRGGYGPWVKTMRALLRLAGVNPRRRSDFRIADSLLQGARFEKIPDRLGARIASRHHLTATQRRQVVQRINRMDGRFARARELERFVRGLERKR